MTGLTGLITEVSHRRDAEGERLPEGQSIVVARTPDGEPIGALRWDYLSCPPVVVDVSVEPDYRLRGVATAMFAAALAVESALVHSDCLTADGAHFVAAQSR